MIDYVALRTHEVIKLMPFIAIILSLILLHFGNMLDKRRPSLFLTNSIFKILSIPILVFSPYLFIITLSNDAFFFFITGLQYMYLFFMFTAPVIVFLYGFEFLISKYMMVELYMDGIKVKWGKIIK